MDLAAAFNPPICSVDNVRGAWSMTHTLPSANPSDVVNGAGVEANARFADDERIIPKAHVGKCVFDDQELVRGAYHMAAKRCIARCFAEREPDGGLKPLPVGIDETHQRNRHVANDGEHARSFVKCFFATGVETVELSEREKALFFLRRDWRQDHDRARVRSSGSRAPF